MKYKIKIERAECIACGSCYTIDSTHFEPDDEGKSRIIGGETDPNRSLGFFDDGEIEKPMDAEDSCPMSIISVTEF